MEVPGLFDGGGRGGGIEVVATEGFWGGGRGGGIEGGVDEAAGAVVEIEHIFRQYNWRVDELAKYAARSETSSSWTR